MGSVYYFIISVVCETLQSTEIIIGQWVVMLPISVEMGHLMYTLLSVLVMECGSQILAQLWTVP